jgi:hypothetical protein
VKRGIIAVVVVAVIAVAAVGVLRWREEQKRAEYAAKMLPDQHDQAFIAASDCDVADQSLQPTMTVGTARFGFTLLNDRKQLAKTLAETITPIISTRQTTCEHARTMLEIYISNSPALDAVAVAKLARVHAHLLRLASLAAAMQATREAITAGASDDELRRHFERLRTN